VVEAEFVLQIAEAPPGEGIMDLAGVLEACLKLPESSALIVEHLTAAQAPKALRFVAGLAAANGISFG